MQAPGLHSQESKRLASLNALDILDTEAEVAFDEIVQLASSIFQTPIALVSLIDEERQWFKAKVGLDVCETSRDLAFCGHAILQDDVFVVKNAKEDSRFADNPLVTEGPKISFYAGAVIRDNQNLPLGTLCIIDSESREFTEEQKQSLQILARQVESQLVIRRQNEQLKKTNKLAQEILSLVAHDLKGAFTIVLGSSTLMTRKLAHLQQHTDVVKIGNRLVSAATDVYELLDELLQWTRLQISEDHIDLESCDIDQIIQSTLKVFEENAKAKQIEVIYENTNGLNIFASRSVTKTILRNLISNSIKHTPQDKKVFVKAEVLDSDVVISVHDEGPGVPDALKPHILKAVQVKPDDQFDAPPSHGVGLYLCNAIAQRQNSRIWLDDSVESGCKMCFSIPLQSAS